MVVGIVVSHNAARLLTAGLLIVAVVMIHNLACHHRGGLYRLPAVADADGLRPLFRCQAGFHLVQNAFGVLGARIV